VSGGILTDIHEATSGQKVEPKYSVLFNAGNITGISVSFLVGLRAATWASTAIGSLKWIGVGIGAVETGISVYGAGKATNNLYQSYQDNGKFEIEDTWNLLAFIPFAGSLLGVKQFLSASRAAKSGTKAINEEIKAAENTITKTGNCFVAGTEILTIEGEKSIEDIKVGDWVIADDPTTPGEIEAKQVLETFVRHTTALVDLYIDGEVISTTGEHPFWTPDLGWVEAKDLHVGSLLQTEDGRIIDVDGVDKREGDFTVYNFKVEGFHTYFVSDLGILVHNANYKKTFFDANPDLEGQVVVHHAVEQQVLNRYPNLLTDAEIHSLDNLRGIPKDINSDIHLSQIRKEWNGFYKNNPNPTKQDLLDFAEHIDNMFGSQFNPPI
jgi:hypothetical protein